MKRISFSLLAALFLFAASPAQALEPASLMPIAPAILRGCSHHNSAPEYREARDFFDQADAASAAGRHQEAIELYNKAIALNPDDACAYNNRGVAQEELGQPDQAMASYNQAITINPSMPEPWENRGHLYLDRGDQARADMDFELADFLYDAYPENN